MNRGLIEADEICGYEAHDLALPRFMNRGLIEAAECGLASPGIGRDFPDS